MGVGGVTTVISITIQPFCGSRSPVLSDPNRQLPKILEVKKARLIHLLLSPCQKALSNTQTECSP